MSGVELEVLAHSNDMRFTQYTLQPGGEIPWHFHRSVSDWYIGRAGIVTVETKDPDDRAELSPGDMFKVPTPRRHRLRNNGATPCCFALVQGVGSYDFHPVTDED